MIRILALLLLVAAIDFSFPGIASAQEIVKEADAYRAAELDLEKSYWKKIYDRREQRWQEKDYSPLGYKKINEVAFTPRFELEDYSQGLQGPTRPGQHR